MLFESLLVFILFKFKIRIRVVLLYWPNSIFSPNPTLTLALTENLSALLDFQMNIIYYFYIIFFPPRGDPQCEKFQDWLSLWWHLVPTCSINK